jgi:hypothetical protein
MRHRVGANAPLPVPFTDRFHDKVTFLPKPGHLVLAITIGPNQGNQYDYAIARTGLTTRARSRHKLLKGCDFPI